MIDFIKELFVMYSPIAITAITCLVNWVSTFKKFKEINIKRDAQEVIDKQNAKIDELKKQLEVANSNNVVIQKQLNEVLTELSKVKHE